QLAKRLAKQGGGGISQRYQPELGLRESGDSRLCAELRTALGNAELSVFYQPIFDLTWNRLVSVEALLRWDHPQHGMLSPAIFLPLAQRSGLM
ncbi:EAL domain-containing protein, partial [Klebsiella pneumoniae]